MADETVVTRDPSKKRFWTAKNIFLLFLTAVVPALGAGIWDKASRFMANHSELQARIEAQQIMIAELDKRLGDKAVWNALADARNEQVKTAIQLGVLQALFDREFAKTNQVVVPAPLLKPPSTTPPPQGAEAPKKPEKSQAELDAEKQEREHLLRLLREAKEGKVYKPDLYRQELERNNPQQRLQAPLPEKAPK
jgi:hypothetical protein